MEIRAMMYGNSHEFPWIPIRHLDLSNCWCEKLGEKLSDAFEIPVAKGQFWAMVIIELNSTTGRKLIFPPFQWINKKNQTNLNSKSQTSLTDMNVVCFSGWWFHFYWKCFTPILGEMIQLDKHIFVQLAWNHQLYGCWTKNVVFFPPHHPILIGFSLIFTIHFGVPSISCWKCSSFRLFGRSELPTSELAQIWSGSRSRWIWGCWKWPAAFVLVGRDCWGTIKLPVNWGDCNNAN